METVARCQDSTLVCAGVGSRGECRGIECLVHFPEHKQANLLTQ